MRSSVSATFDEDYLNVDDNLEEFQFLNAADLAAIKADVDAATER
jgi:hypothetical protein